METNRSEIASVVKGAVLFIVVVAAVVLSLHVLIGVASAGTLDKGALDPQQNTHYNPDKPQSEKQNPVTTLCNYDMQFVTVGNVTSSGFDIKSTDPKAHCLSK